MPCNLVQPRSWQRRRNFTRDSFFIIVFTFVGDILVSELGFLFTVPVMSCCRGHLLMGALRNARSKYEAATWSGLTSLNVRSLKNGHITQQEGWSHHNMCQGGEGMPKLSLQIGQHQLSLFALAFFSSAPPLDARTLPKKAESRFSRRHPQVHRTFDSCPCNKKTFQFWEDFAKH